MKTTTRKSKPLPVRTEGPSFKKLVKAFGQTGASRIVATMLEEPTGRRRSGATERQ